MFLYCLGSTVRLFYRVGIYDEFTIVLYSLNSLYSLLLLKYKLLLYLINPALNLVE